MVDHGADCWEIYHNDPDDVLDGCEGDESMMEQFPEGYNYACCDGIYGSKPCMVGTHEAHPSRARLAGSAIPAAKSEPVMIPEEEEDEDEDEEGTDVEEDGEEGGEDDDERPSKKRKL